MGGTALPVPFHWDGATPRAGGALSGGCELCCCWELAALLGEASAPLRHGCGGEGGGIR